MKTPPLAAAVLAATLSTGCFSSEPSRYFTLEAVPPRAPSSLAGAPLALEAVALPPALEREEIVLETGPNRLEVRGLDLWAAAPGALALRALALDLARRLPEGRVVLPGQPLPEGPVRSLHVVVERFAAVPEEGVALEASFTLAPASEGGRPLAGRERVTAPLASRESGDVAAGMSAALAALADRIVARMAEEREAAPVKAGARR